MNKDKLIEWFKKEIEKCNGGGALDACRAGGIEDALRFIQSEPEEPSYAELKYAYDLQTSILKQLENENKELAGRVVAAEHLISSKELKEKTNFDVITESPERLAAFIIEIQNDTKNGQEWLIDEHCVGYLNQKAGE